VGFRLVNTTNTNFSDRESGWQSGKELEFYPSNPGSTPARVSTTKKKKNPTKCALTMTADLQGVLKNIF